MKKPLLVSGTDGVGTKLKIAFLMDKHDTVGIDCVAMCVNDIVCSGPIPSSSWTTWRWARTCPRGLRPLSRASPPAAARRAAPWWAARRRDARLLPRGRVRSGRLCRGIGGSGEDDRRLHPPGGDLLIGLSSNGVHSNGFSLVRKVLHLDNPKALDIHVSELGHTIGEELLRPPTSMCAPSSAYAKTGSPSRPSAHHRRRPV